MRFQEMIETVDTHTGGEPTGLIISGFSMVYLYSVM